MPQVLKFIFEQMTDPLTLPIHPLLEWIIIGVLGIIAYKKAFSFVGDLYRSGMIHGSTIGSFIHWTVRFVLFVSVWAITWVLIASIQLCVAYWYIVLTSGLAVAAIAVIATVIVHKMQRKTENL